MLHNGDFGEVDSGTMGPKQKPPSTTSQESAKKLIREFLKSEKALPTALGRLAVEGPPLGEGGDGLVYAVEFEGTAAVKILSPPVTEHPSEKYIRFRRERVAESDRGRVLALQTTLIGGIALVGGPLVGQIADLAGERAPIAIGGAACLTAAGLGELGRRRFPQGDFAAR
jgi:hypothetical protein